MDFNENEYESLLRQFQPRQPGVPPAILPVVRVRRQNFWPAAAASVILVAGMSLAIRNHFASNSDPRTVLEIVDGTVSRVVASRSQIAKAGAQIEGGEILRSDRGVGATFKLADGSRIEMREQSELSLESGGDGVKIRLNRGGIIVNAAKQRTGHLYVQTKDVTVSVVGTVFFVNSEETGSRVGVVEGEVHVQQGQNTQKLLPGDQLVTQSSMPSILVGDEISWSHSAPAHMALLRKSTIVDRPLLEFEAASIRPDPQPALGAALGPLVCQGVDGGDHFPPELFGNFPSSAPLGRCVGRWVNLLSLIVSAYDVPQRNVSGGPDWAGATRGAIETFQIEAKSENPGTTTRDQLRQMLQTLLAERFKLKVRRETKQSPGYALVVAKNGILKPAVGPEEPLVIHTGGGGGGPRGEAPGGPKVVITGKTSMGAFATFFRRCPQMEGRIVVDKTGLAGSYDFNLTLNWIPGTPPTPGVAIVPTCSPIYDPPLPKALEEQLGLRLEPGLTVPEDFIIIEYAEKPSAN